MSKDIDLAMTPPRILVLDDEDIQRRTIHHQLAELGGEFVDFADPRDALAFLRDHAVEAVVADIRMPGLPVDGLWFLAELRQLDREVGVVLRTGDEDVAIAQAGIEARAIQRVLKAQPDSRARLRAAVKTAIDETRERRRIVTAAAEASRARGELVSALGRMDDEITVAEMCRGFVQGLTNHVTTLAGYSELLLEHASAANDATLAELAQKNRSAASRLSAQVAEFMSNPYLEGVQSSAPTAGANACVEALNQIFRQHALFSTGNRCKFSGRGLLPDASFSANPTRILTALRHLVEYCALRMPAGETVALIVTLSSQASAVAKTSEGSLVINGRRHSQRPVIVFTIQADIGRPKLAAIRDDLRHCSSDPRVGNLLMLGAAIIDDRLALEIAHSAKGLTAFNLYIPTASLYS